MYLGEEILKIFGLGEVAKDFFLYARSGILHV